MTWKYGMILMGWEGPGVEILREPREEGDEPLCMLVELFTNDEGEYTSFCSAEPRTPKELAQAAADVEADGINRYFFDNGHFTHEPQRDPTEKGYQFYWHPSEEAQSRSAFAGIDEELEAVDQEFLDELEEKHPGKVIVYTGREVHAVYDTFSEAMQAGTPDGSSLVCLSNHIERMRKEIPEIEHWEFENSAMAVQLTCEAGKYIKRKDVEATHAILEGLGLLREVEDEAE